MGRKKKDIRHRRTIRFLPPIRGSGTEGVDTQGVRSRGGRGEEMHDYVVVGAGSAGCTIAARLSELPDANILLLEAGPSDTSPYIHMPVGFYKMTTGPLTWGYKTAPQRGANQRTIAYPQGRVVG